MASLPVTYMNQPNAWVNTIFLSWIRNHFVPFIQKKITGNEVAKESTSYSRQLFSSSIGVGMNLKVGGLKP